MPSTYRSQAARDAEAMNYGGPSYWAYLDDSAAEHAAYFVARGDAELAASMVSRSLAEALMGNDGS